MKINNRLKLVLSVAACVGSFLLTPQVSAATTYHVSVDTTALVGNPNAPFSLDFELNSGNGVFNNSWASIGNVTGGGPFGALFLAGGATGDLSVSPNVSLTDSNFSNYLFQEFTPGGILSFDLALWSTATGVTPDSFAFAISGDGLGVSSFFDVFVQIDLLNGGQTLSVSPQDGVTVSVQVPETASLVTLPMALVVIGLFGRGIRKRHLAAAA